MPSHQSTTNKSSGRSSNTSIATHEEGRATISTTEEDTSSHHTIALLGAGSPTATHFLRLALDAGYHVRALLIQSDYALASRSTYQGRASLTAKKLKEEFADCRDLSLEWVRTGSIYDRRAVANVLHGVQYVVCMMNDAPLVCEGQDEGQQPIKYNAQKKKKLQLPEKPLTSFLQEVLYPLMRREKSIQVFLYQVIAS